MTRRWVVVACIAVLLLLVVPVSADWLSGWSARKSHVINNTGDALSDYQMKFVVHRTDGTDSGEDVYVGTNCNDDYSDLRFTTIDNTPMSYWIESYDANSATVWVKVPAIPTSGTQMYLYYGNSAAESASNGDDTFLFFDDFSGTSLDTEVWSEYSDPGVSISDSILTLTSKVSDDAAIYTSSSVSTELIVIESRVKSSHFGYTSEQESFEPLRYSSDTLLRAAYTAGAPSEGGMYINRNAGSQSLSNITGWNANEWYIHSCERTGSCANWSIDYSNEVTMASNYPAGKSGAIRFGVFKASYNGPLYIDWVRTRAFSTNKPFHSTWFTLDFNENPPSADFSGVPTSGIVPLTVYFTDNSSSTGNETVTIDTWSWDFGDESPASTDQNPAHQYTTSGTYTVALTASNATYGTTDTETKTDYITVNIDTAAPSADFVATPLCEDVGDPIYFIDYSTGGGLYAWNWSFGDSSYSELRNPTHTYASNGTYDISLTVWGANGTDTLTKTGYITIPCGAATPTPTPTGTTVTPTSSVTPGEVTESNVTYIYSDDQTFVPWALWLAVVGVMIAFFGHSLIFTRNTDLTATMACVLAFVAAGLSNMIGYIDIGVAAVGTDVAITPMIKAVHPPWLVYVMVMFALVSILNIVYQAWRIYLKPKDWSAIYRKRYERY